VTREAIDPQLPGAQQLVQQLLLAGRWLAMSIIILHRVAA